MADSFPLAAKSVEPTHYYLLLRALFRAIGGHKFDTMYTAVTPLFQETLNKLLAPSPPNMRDPICRVVPHCPCSPYSSFALPRVSVEASGVRFMCWTRTRYAGSLNA